MPEADNGESEPAGGRRQGKWLRRFLLALGPLVALAGASYYYATSGRYVATDNAYIKSDKILISADLSGRVVAVAARQDQVVDAGELLFQIDPEPHRLKIARAEARLNALRYEIAAYKGAYRQKFAELKMAEEDVGYFRREHGRQSKLANRGIIAGAKLDEARHRLQMAEKRIVAVRADMARVLASLGGNPKLPAEQHPQYREAMVALEQTMFDLRRASVYAPVGGVLTNVELQAGEFVEAGRPVFGLLAREPLWIEANLKETDLTHVAVGQPAIVRVDAYPDRVWRAVVASLSPTTGAEFALLPPQNASGNWVKVVQRVPVRLTLEDRVDRPTLRAGMSVHVEIDTGHERALPQVVKSALAWVRDRR